VPPTIYDIAREARVGIGTVSRVFNNHPSVSDETRKRVLRVASRLDYHPHPFARGLARRRTNAILVFVPFVASFFFVEILQAVQQRLAEVDCDLILHGVPHPDHAELSLRRNSFRGRVDGILFFSMTMPAEFAEEYMNLKVPVVLVDTSHKKFDSFSVENVNGAYTATNHLLDLGHTRLGMLNACADSPPARERLKGFRSALKDAGIEPNADWIRHSPPGRLDGFTKEAGYQLAKEMFRGSRKLPSALVVASDIQAVGALEAIREEGLRVPEDVALIGFDDIELARHFGITTMRQPMSEMGTLAASRLIERMANPALPIIHQSFLPQLVVRRSTRLESPRTANVSPAVPLAAESST
jgi:DNA-binding LacI/PurR family transcriptional regulator